MFASHSYQGWRNNKKKSLVHILYPWVHFGVVSNNVKTSFVELTFSVHPVSLPIRGSIWNRLELWPDLHFLAESVFTRPTFISTVRMKTYYSVTGTHNHQCQTQLFTSVIRVFPSKSPLRRFRRYMNHQPTTSKLESTTSTTTLRPFTRCPCPLWWTHPSIVLCCCSHNQGCVRLCKDVSTISTWMFYGFESVIPHSFLFGARNCKEL